MGLFDFMKKKELPLPSEPAEQKPASDLGDITNIPPPPEELKSSAETPEGLIAEPPKIQPPSVSEETSKSEILSAKDKSLSKPVMPSKEPLLKTGQRELPLFEIPKKTMPEQKLPIPEPTPIPHPQPASEEAFELPDFDDGELKQLEEIKTSEKKELPKPVKKEPDKPKPIFKPVPKIKYPEPAEPKAEISEQKFVDTNNYLTAKDNLTEAKTLITSTQNLVSKHAKTSKAKDEKYASFVKELNIIQEKLMIIDDKLFEGI